MSDHLRHEVATAMQAALLEQLARCIAHEVNQPLAAVVANASAAGRWLDRDPPDIAETRAALQRAIHEARHAGDLLRGLGATLRRHPRREDRLEVASLLQAAAALAQPRAERERVAIEVADASGLAVRGDRLDVLQVLLHLLDNAIDALAEHEGDRRVALDAKATGGEVEFGVSDTGPGIAPALAEKVFQPLYTLRARGAGLGLTACRAIVESHGGRIRVAPDTAGGGAIVRFTLPGAA